MFESPGKKIKLISIVVFWLVTITSVILAFVFGFEKKYGYYTDYTVFNAGIFFALFIGVPVISYIITLFLVGFGELVDNSSKTESQKDADFTTKQAEIMAEEERERIIAENISAGREADADPNLTDEEIEAELEAELNESANQDDSI